MYDNVVLLNKQTAISQFDALIWLLKRNFIYEVSVLGHFKIIVDGGVENHLNLKAFSTLV